VSAEVRQLLADLREVGVSVELAGDDNLRIAGSKAIIDSYLTKLIMSKADLIACLKREGRPEGREGSRIGPAEVGDRTWRVVVEGIDPPRGPVRLNGWTSISDPARCIEADLTSLEVAVLHMNSGVRSIFTTLIDEYLERLRACGCEARVEALS
jgi:hypothetical protein